MILHQVNTATPGQYFDISPSSLEAVYRKNDTVTFEIKATLKNYMPTQTAFVIDFSSFFSTIMIRRYNISNPASPFFFAIISPVTRNQNELLRLLNEQILSTNVDIPEATLDAVVQSVICNQVQCFNCDN
ncbi:hypothetical protein MXB_3310 [Myxobolus squamalis]|nr:hypothetical protein MXB_3310 [Myxobolus squamalis]